MLSPSRSVSRTLFVLFVCLFILFEFDVAFNNISVCVTTVSGCDRDLIAHYNAALLKYHSLVQSGPKL